MDQVDLITLRDELSLKDLKDIRVSKPRMHVTADPVFSMKTVSRDANKILKDVGFLRINL